MGRFVDAVVPARLGRDFRWLLGSSWSTNLGDGLAVAAGPLLVASLTDDPRLVAMGLLVQWLPQLLFGLYAGVLADRLDRRRLIVVVNLVRVAVLAGLSTMIWTGSATVALVLTILFVLGIAETFADTTTSTLLPMIVAKADLGIANARLMAGFATMNQLAGPSIGAALFVVGAAVPYTAQTACVALGVALVSRITVSGPVRTGERAGVRAEVAAGIRWLWRNPPMRTLTLTILAFNVTFGAAWSVLVLLATQRLGMGEVGYGILLTTSAVGGLISTTAYGWLERRLPLATLMRIGLVIETLVHLSLALTTVPWVAMVTLFAFGAEAFVWGTISASIRQRAVPTEFMGRVGSVYRIGVVGGLVVGSALGGQLAARWGVTAPFWFAFVGSAVILVLIWRELVNIAHADADDTPGDEAPAGAAV